MMTTPPDDSSSLPTNPGPPLPESNDPSGPGGSPQTRAFIRQMVENLNTHQPGVPRGRNTGNCLQPEFSPAAPADVVVNGAGKNGHDDDDGAAAVGR